MNTRSLLYKPCVSYKCVFYKIILNIIVVYYVCVCICMLSMWCDILEIKKLYLKKNYTPDIHTCMYIQCRERDIVLIPRPRSQGTRLMSAGDQLRFPVLHGSWSDKNLQCLWQSPVYPICERTVTNKIHSRDPRGIRRDPEGNQREKPQSPRPSSISCSLYCTYKLKVVGIYH
jgi:hypothetical protein